MNRLQEISFSGKEYGGQRVVTFSDVDVAHEFDSGTAKRAFHDNSEYLIEGVDFFVLSHDEYYKNFSDSGAPEDGMVILLTKVGYIMLSKVFNDSLSWAIMRSLLVEPTHDKDGVEAFLHMLSADSQADLERERGW